MTSKSSLAEKILLWTLIGMILYLIIIGVVLVTIAATRMV